MITLKELCQSKLVEIESLIFLRDKDKIYDPQRERLLTDEEKDGVNVMVKF